MSDHPSHRINPLKHALDIRKMLLVGKLCSHVLLPCYDPLNVAAWLYLSFCPVSHRKIWLEDRNKSTASRFSHHLPKASSGIRLPGLLRCYGNSRKPLARYMAPLPPSILPSRSRSWCYLCNRYASRHLRPCCESGDESLLIIRVHVITHSTFCIRAAKKNNKGNKGSRVM